MKTSDINQGGRYLAHITIPAGPRTPRIRTTRTVTVIAKDTRTVTVEALEQVCVNLDQFAPEAVTRAMLTGQLRYEQRPTSCQLRAADILGPAPKVPA